ncbi:MAG: HlyC/CorC family transporter [bacterium]|nr:HlyC/CorC family transporter [bacterium]
MGSGENGLTALLIFAAAYLFAMLMVGLLAAYSRVVGLYRNGLLDAESLGRDLRRSLEVPQRLAATAGTLHLAATAVGCLAAGRWAAAAWPGLSGARFYVAVALAVAVFWSLGAALARWSARGAGVAAARLQVRAMAPAVWLLRPWTSLLMGMGTRPEDTLPGADAGTLLSAGEIRSLIDDRQEGVSLENDEREMIQSIFDFRETAVREIMIPRIDMVALDAGCPVREAVRAVEECRHSRIPLYEGGIDRVVGLLYAKDLLSLVDGEGLRDGDRKVGGLARPAYFIPESKRLDEVLAEFRSQRIHMAVVIDEYGGTAGLVTLEDVLEEIVGEIEDEFDEQESLFTWLDDRSLRVDPKINLEDLQDVLGIELPLGEGSETLAGLIYEAAGRVPEQGDRVAIAGLDIEVERVEDRRIMQVRLAASAPLPGRQPQEAPE